MDSSALTLWHLWQVLTGLPKLGIQISSLLITSPRAGCGQEHRLGSSGNSGQRADVFSCDLFKDGDLIHCLHHTAVKLLDAEKDSHVIGRLIGECEAAAGYSLSPGESSSVTSSSCKRAISPKQQR